MHLSQAIPVGTSSSGGGAPWLSWMMTRDLLDPLILLTSLVFGTTLYSSDDWLRFNGPAKITASSVTRNHASHMSVSFPLNNANQPCCSLPDSLLSSYTMPRFLGTDFFDECFFCAGARPSPLPWPSKFTHMSGACTTAFVDICKKTTHIQQRRGMCV